MNFLKFKRQLNCEVEGKPEYAHSSKESEVVDKEQKKEEVETEIKGKLADAQELIAESLSEEERSEILQKGSNQLSQLIESIFGKNTAFSNLILSLVEQFLPSESGSNSISWENFTNSKDDLIEKSIIAHRSLGYSGKENSIEAIKSAAEKGETEIELDVRLNTQGEIVLAHDNTTESINSAVKFTDAINEMKKHSNVTYFIDLKGETTLVNKLAEVMSDNDLVQQFIFTAFNPKALESATKLFPNRPVFFHYFPKGKLQFLDLATELVKSDIPLVKDNVRKVLTSIDERSGTSYLKQIDKLLLFSNEQDPLNLDHQGKDIIHLYNKLPPSAILELVKQSGGAISVPWLLVKDWPEFFEEAKKLSVKVAVFGLGEKGDLATRDAKIQKAIAMGANYIISDQPNVI